MSYEAIAKGAANLSFTEQLTLLAYLANLIKAREQTESVETPKDYRATYHKGFFDLFGSDPDFDLEEPEDIPIELDGEVIF